MGKIVRVQTSGYRPSQLSAPFPADFISYPPLRTLRIIHGVLYNSLFSTVNMKCLGWESHDL